MKYSEASNYFLTFTRIYLHCAEEFSVLVISLILADQKIKFINELAFDETETSAGRLLALHHVVEN